MKREALSRHVAALLLNAFERGGGNAVATSQIATAIIEKLRALAPGCDRRSQQAREVASFEARVVTAIERQTNRRRPHHNLAAPCKRAATHARAGAQPM